MGCGRRRLGALEQLREVADQGGLAARRWAGEQDGEVEAQANGEVGKRRSDALGLDEWIVRSRGSRLSIAAWRAREKDASDAAHLGREVCTRQPSMQTRLLSICSRMGVGSIRGVRKESDLARHDEASGSVDPTELFHFERPDVDARGFKGKCGGGFDCVLVENVGRSEVEALALQLDPRLFAAVLERRKERDGEQTRGKRVGRLRGAEDRMRPLCVGCADLVSQREGSSRGDAQKVEQNLIAQLGLLCRDAVQEGSRGECGEEMR